MNRSLKKRIKAREECTKAPLPRAAVVSFYGNTGGLKIAPQNTVPGMIRRAREAKGISQRRLGELTGLKGKSAECAVQNWEHARRPVPNVRIRALSEALGLPLDKLIP